MTLILFLCLSIISIFSSIREIKIALKKDERYIPQLSNKKFIGYDKYYYLFEEYRHRRLYAFIRHWCYSDEVAKKWFFMMLMVSALCAILGAIILDIVLINYYV